MSGDITTTNTFSNSLHPNLEIKTNFLIGTWMYQISLSECDMSYIGHSVNCIKIFKNHVLAFEKKKPEI